MKTPLMKRGETAPKWWIVDAGQEVLGRAATKIATILQGKHKPIYTPHVDTGDFVIVLNAGKIQVTAEKDKTKIYQWYTGWHGGRKLRPLEWMRVRSPETVIRSAVWRMLPKGRLGREMLRKLKIYRGTAHPHDAQKPEALALGTGRK
jgi:large subunit ribosomal protein L13